LCLFFIVRCEHYYGTCALQVAIIIIIIIRTPQGTGFRGAIVTDHVSLQLQHVF
jgi:hypothetical protein